MRLRVPGIVLTAGLTLAAAAGVVGQVPPPSFGGGGQGGLAQFGGAQTGVAPQPTTLGLLPGQEGRLALYCADLFHDTPTDRHTFTAAADPRAVVAAGGDQMPLHEAIAAGLLSVRGRDPRTDPPRNSRQWIDLYVINHTQVPLQIHYPAGYAFVPRGRTAPALAPGLVRMLETAYHARLTGTDTLAYAMWASRGFTRRDVEQTQLRPIPDRDAAVVQELLDRGEIDQRFDREADAYEKLYAKREEKLGDDAQPIQGTTTLATGVKATVTGKKEADGRALVAIQPARAPEPLYYEARMKPVRNAKAELELLHLKTGRPLQVNGGKILVRLES